LHYLINGCILMKKKTVHHLSLFFFTLFFSLKSLALSPVGYWLVKSPFLENRPIVIVKIYLKRNILCGEIIQIMPLNRSVQNFHKRLSSGLVVLCNYHQVQNKWVGGTIYEQTTAKLYDSSIELDESGMRLKVTGYYGPFSKTATWDRLRSS